MAARDNFRPETIATLVEDRTLSLKKFNVPVDVPIARATITEQERAKINEDAVDKATGRCRLCQKMAVDAHMTSADHKARVDEEVLSTRLAGMSVSGRRFTSQGVGFTGTVTKRNIRAFWGEAVDYMAEVALKQIVESGGIEVRGVGSPFKVSREDVKGVNLCLVSYSAHMGKKAYLPKVDDQDRSRLLEWIDVPDSEETSSLDMQEAGANQGWWPVVSVEVSPSVLKWYRELMDVSVDQIKIIRCFYQCLSETDNVGWVMQLYRPEPSPRAPPRPALENEGGWDEPDWVMADADAPPPEPAPQVPVLRLRGNGPPPPPPPPPPTWGDTRRPGAIAAEAEEVD